MAPVILPFFLFLSLLFSGALAATFTLKNNCPYTIWPSGLSGAGSPRLSRTGFELAPNGSSSVDVPSPWSGRFWARTACATDPQSGLFKCATGDCGSGKIECDNLGGAPPVSLIEHTLAGYAGQDFYDISLVDGFNLPLSVKVQDEKLKCKEVTCATNVNEICPRELVLTVTTTSSSNNTVIGCKSACLALNEDKYCCRGAYSTPTTCPPTNYSMVFKNACPQAYSYAYDDATSTFTCPTGANYLITFCP